MPGAFIHDDTPDQIKTCIVEWDPKASCPVLGLILSKSGHSVNNANALTYPA
jgi:hypothetical protein